MLLLDDIERQMSRISIKKSDCGTIHSHLHLILHYYFSVTLKIILRMHLKISDGLGVFFKIGLIKSKANVYHTLINFRSTLTECFS